MIVANGLVRRYGKGTDSDATDTMVVAHALEASDGHHGYSSPRGDGCDNLIAAPLTVGGHPNSNMPGRRKEDDENLVTAFHQTQDPIHGDDFTSGLGETSIGMGVGIGASVRRLTPTECERLQALPDGWTNPTGVAPDSRRYAGLGDAVTASVAEWIGRRILASGG